MQYFSVPFCIFFVAFQGFFWGVSTLLSAQNPDKFELTAKDIEINNKKQRSFFRHQIVTASRLQESSDKAPANVQVITEEQIRLRGYRTLLEVLRDLGAFKISDSASEEWSHEITLNGVERHEKIVLLLDGLRISSPTNEMTAYLENYPPQLARQIEIIYGPASALYGADAMTCVINIITKEGNRKVSADFMPYGGSNNMYGGYGQLSFRMSGNRSFTFGGQYSYDPQPNLPEIFSQDTLWDMNNGYRTGTFQTNFGAFTPEAPVKPEYSSILKNYVAFAKLRLSDFNFTLFHNYSQVSSSASVTPQNSIYNEAQFIGQSITTFGAQYTKVYDKITSSTTLQGNWYEMNPKSNFRNLFTGMEYGYKYSFSTRGKIEQQLTWQARQNLSLIGGTSYERFFSIPKTADLTEPISRESDIAGFYMGTNLEMKIFSIIYSNLGFYGQIQYSPSSKLHLTLGSRYDYNSRFGGTFNPRLGIVWQPTDQTNLKALFGSAFLAPLPFYSHGHWGSFYTEDNGLTYRSGYIHAPNPDLAPLKLNTFEIQAQHIFQNRLSVRFNAFYTHLTGLFVYLPDEGNTNLYGGKFLGWDVDLIETITNANEQDNWGGGLRLDYNKRVEKLNLNAWLSANFSDGRRLQEDGNYYQVGLLSTWQYRAGFDISCQKFTASTRLVAMNTQRLATLKEGTSTRQKIAGYYVINSTLRYQFWKESAVFIDIRNLTNNRYFVPTRSGNKNGGYQFAAVPQWTLRIFAGLQLQL